MNCPQCGVQNNDNEVYCKECFSMLKSEESNQQTAEQNQNPNVNQNAGQMPYQQPNMPPQGYPPPYHQNVYADENVHATVKDWLEIMLIPLIPCIGGIWLLVKLINLAFGDTPKKSLKTYAQVQLWITAITFVLTIIVFIILFASGYSFESFFETGDYSDYSLSIGGFLSSWI